MYLSYWRLKMKSIKNMIKVVGLASMLGACSTPNQGLESQVFTSPQNRTVELTPQEKKILSYQAQFKENHELALKAYGVYVRNSDRNGVDKLIAEKAFRDYHASRIRMFWAIEHIRHFGAEEFADYAEKIVEKLPY